MIELTQVRLQELRAEHQAFGCRIEGCEDPECQRCGCGHPWPCEQSAILDMALEAERLRAAARDFTEAWERDDEHGMAVAGQNIRDLSRALAGTEAQP